MATTKTQRYIIGGAVVIGILLLFSERSSETAGTGSGADSTGTRPCTVTVTADTLNVRTTPDGDASVVEIFDKGAVMSADRTTRNGFRQLGPDRWAAQEFLAPTADSDCG